MTTALRCWTRRIAVQIGVVYNYLPLMIFPLFVALDRLDPALREASKDLGAEPLEDVPPGHRCRSPRPGIVAGLLLVFIPLAGDYITAIVLGGAKGNMAGALVATQFLQAQNWALGSAMAVVLIVTILVARIAAWPRLMRAVLGRDRDRRRRSVHARSAPCVSTTTSDGRRRRHRRRRRRRRFDTRRSGSACGPCSSIVFLFLPDRLRRRPLVHRRPRFARLGRASPPSGTAGCSTTSSLKDTVIELVQGGRRLARIIAVVLGGRSPGVALARRPGAVDRRPSSSSSS